MKEKIISWEEFEQLDQNEQRELLTALKDSVGTSTIIEQWGISRSKFYNLLNKLNIPKGKIRNKPSELVTLGSDKLYIVINAEFLGSQIPDKLSMLNSIVREDTTYKVKIEIIER